LIVLCTLQRLAWISVVIWKSQQFCSACSRLCEVLLLLTWRRQLRNKWSLCYERVASS
jgi:hypothetical protein